MGYTTDFKGQFEITPKLRPEDRKFLKKFSETRRVKRNVDPKYGVDGEFYVEGKGFMGQDDDETIIDGNTPPSTQPSLWCQWTPNKAGTALAWDGGEKFYDYVEWLQYLIDKILAPRGYKLNGQVEWKGEDSDDLGIIIVKDNTVTTKTGRVTYS